MTEESASYIVYYFSNFYRSSVLPATFILVLNFNVSSLPLTLLFHPAIPSFNSFNLLLYGILSSPLSGSPSHSAFSDGDSFVIYSGPELVILHPMHIAHDRPNEYSFYRAFSFFISL